MQGDEENLVKGLRSGDERAFDEFVRQYGPRIYNLQCWLCGDRTAAEDLAQETVIAVFRSIGAYRGRSRLYTWVFQVARHIAHRYGKCRRKDCVPLDAASEIEAPEDTEQLARQALLRDRVREALRLLPEAQRETVVLHYLQGFSHAETARVLQRPLGTVKWQIAHGLHALRDALPRVGDDVDEL